MHNVEILLRLVESKLISSVQFKMPYGLVVEIADDDLPQRAQFSGESHEDAAEKAVYHLSGEMHRTRHDLTVSALRLDSMAKILSGDFT